MEKTLWSIIDNFYNALFQNNHDCFDKIQKNAANNDLPDISISASQGSFLSLMIQISRAQRVLEIGTLAGYSTLWMAKALPINGEIITLEYSKNYAKIAQQNFNESKYSTKIKLIIGPALHSLEKLKKDNTQNFDMIFIDADKENYTNYFQHTLKMSKPGTLIIFDNMIRGGRVADYKTTDEKAIAARNVAKAISLEPKVEAVAIQTVGSKGYDGFVIARVKSN